MWLPVVVVPCIVAPACTVGCRNKQAHELTDGQLLNKQHPMHIAYIINYLQPSVISQLKMLSQSAVAQAESSWTAPTSTEMQFYLSLIVDMCVPPAMLSNLVLTVPLKAYHFSSRLQASSC